MLLQAQMPCNPVTLCRDLRTQALITFGSPSAAPAHLSRQSNQSSTHLANEARCWLGAHHVVFVKFRQLSLSNTTTKLSTIYLSDTAHVFLFMRFVMIFSLLLLLLDSSRGQRPHYQKAFSKAPETGSINTSVPEKKPRKSSKIVRLP